MALGDFFSGYPNQIAFEAMTLIHRYATDQAATKLGQVVQETDAGFDVRLTDGSTLSGVGNGARAKWQPDDWVTLERVGDHWQIVGRAPARGG